jgi:hypothetical protein
MAPEDKKEEGCRKLLDEVLPSALAKIDNMMCGTKFICGDMIT